MSDKSMTDRISLLFFIYVSIGRKDNLMYIECFNISMNIDLRSSFMIIILLVCVRCFYR